VGMVANLYVDEDSRQLRFLDILTSDFLGLERKHHLLPVEVVSEEDPGSITLRVNQETVESAPDLPNPHVVPDEEYQRTIREHYGYSQYKSELPYCDVCELLRTPYMRTLGRFLSETV
jgi:hypothetical protein